MAKKRGTDKWPRDFPSSDEMRPGDPTAPMPPPRDDVEAEVVERLRQELPHYGSPELRPVQFAEVYARLAAVAVARAEFLGKLLADAYAQYGNDALWRDETDVDPQWGTYETGRAHITALVQLEAAERDRAERLSREAIKLGIEAKRLDVMRGYGRTVVAAMEALCAQLGVNWHDEGTKRAAQRAVIEARRSLGYDYRSPDAAGPELTEAERERALQRR